MIYLSLLHLTHATAGVGELVLTNTRAQPKLYAQEDNMDISFPEDVLEEVRASTPGTIPASINRTVYAFLQETAERDHLYTLDDRWQMRLSSTDHLIELFYQGERLHQLTEADLRTLYRLCTIIIRKSSAA